MTIHGTCGNCGGCVKTPDIWYGVNTPTPACERCGATTKNPYGPRIEMEPKPQPTQNGCMACGKIDGHNGLQCPTLRVMSQPTQDKEMSDAY